MTVVLLVYMVCTFAAISFFTQSSKIIGLIPNGNFKEKVAQIVKNKPLFAGITSVIFVLIGHGILSFIYR